MNPETWEEVNIGQLAFEVRKKNKSNSEFPVLSMTKYDGFVESLDYFNKQVFSRNLSTYKIVEKGQFAYATIHLDEGSIDCLRSHDKGLISPMYTVFEIDESRVDRKFLFYLLKSPAMVHMYGFIGQGSINRRKSISFKTLSNVPISLPPLPEQKKIAAILSSVDEAIQATQAVIDQTRKVKKGLLQQLLTRGIGHTKFKQTEIGEIPESWEQLTVAELIKRSGEGEIKTGPFGTLLSAEEYTDQGTPLVAVKEIREGFIAIHPETPRVPAEVVARLSAYLLKDGDIVFARKGGVERCAVVKLNTPMMLGSDAMRLRLSQRVVPDFIGYALQSGQHQRWMLAQASGSIMSGLNQKIIARIPLLLPPVQEQLGIVKILSSVDEPIRKGIHQAEQLQKTKQGLLQDLLTGKVRVTP